MITGLYLTHGDCEDAAFERTWHGTQEYFLEDYSGKGSSKRKRKRKKKADAIEAITVSTFKDGVSICLKRGELTFSESGVVKNATSGFNCPRGSEPCSKEASVTICLEPLRHETECPITDVKLLQREDYSKELYPLYSVAPKPDSIDID